MQITFDPTQLKTTEAGLILGYVLPRVVRGFQAQGATLAEIQAEFAELVAQGLGQISENKDT